MKQLPFLLERSGERPIHGRWHLPEAEAQAEGTILFLHGYKGYMDWGAWSMVGDACAQAGWRMLRINFTHNGTTPETPADFTDIEAFASNTYRRELEETLAVIEALRTTGPSIEGATVHQPLAIIGHSRGGGIACLAAKEADKQLKRAGNRGVDALVTWAAVADFGTRFPQGSAFDEWRSSGRLEVINHRTRQILHHDWSFYADFEHHAQRLNIEQAVRDFGGRVMVAHSTDDAAVDVDHALRLHAWSSDGTLELLKHGGHTFGAMEPWTELELPESLMALTQATLRFLKEGRAAE